MTTRVTLKSQPDGSVVVQKSLVDANKVALGRAEAEWLSTARHPGVVQLIDTSEEPFTINTRHAGANTLRTAKPTPTEAATALANTANTLADLHDDERVHGNVTMDHIIMAEANKAILCSPHGRADDPNLDLAGLGQVVNELLQRWSEPKSAGDLDSDEVQQWSSVAQRLTDSTLSARRAARIFQRLAEANSDAPSLPPIGTPSAAKLLALATGIVVLACVAALWPLLGPTPAGPQDNGATVQIGTTQFRVGSAADVVAEVPQWCKDQPKAVLLDTKGNIWAFMNATDGEQAKLVATVAGATDLVTDSSQECGRVWATGPAGRSLIVNGR